MENITDGPLLFAHDGFTATLTLNRPEKKNAINTEMWVAIRDTFRRAAGDDSVVCVLLVGAGDDFRVCQLPELVTGPIAVLSKTSACYCSNAM